MKKPPSAPLEAIEDPGVPQHPSVTAGIMGRTFWMLCTMEMWERLAYYGVRVVMPVYIAQADEPGGLHFTQSEKGAIYAWWAFFQSVLPTFTGGFADRYGYKKNLVFSITLKVIGYLLMATQRDYWGFFIGVMVLATGTAQFKPAIQGSIAQTLGKGKTSVGWGIFYWLVNVGAMVGPFLAHWLKAIGWSELFYACAAIVSLNYLMLFTYPEVRSGADTNEPFLSVVATTFKNLLNARLLMFLAILTGFWLMMYQLWDLHPNFIVDWIDSRTMAAMLPPWMSEDTGRGAMVSQEHLLNLNALLIVLLIIPVSALVRRMRTLSSMLAGMTMATCAILLGGLTQSAWVLAAAIALFSAGEMLTGPKKNEYLGLIAPPGKKALFLGYVNIPVGVGIFIGSPLASWLYGNYAEKAVLAQRYLAEHTDYLSEHGRPAWDGEISSLADTVGVEREHATATLAEVLAQTPQEVTDLLWNTYSPYQIWYVFAAIGVLSTIALIVYNRAARGWKDMDY